MAKWPINRNFRVFHFRCLSNWQKIFNGKNFLIYGSFKTLCMHTFQTRKKSWACLELCTVRHVSTHSPHPAPPFLFMHNVLSFKAECGMQSNLDDIKNKYCIVGNFICPNFWQNSVSRLEEIFTVLIFAFSASYWPSPFIVAGQTTIWTSWKSAAIRWLIKKWMTYQLFWLWFDDQNESR